MLSETRMRNACFVIGLATALVTSQAWGDEPRLARLKLRAELQVPPSIGIAVGFTYRELVYAEVEHGTFIASSDTRLRAGMCVFGNHLATGSSGWKLSVMLGPAARYQKLDLAEDGHYNVVSSWSLLGTLDLDATYQRGDGMPGFSVALITGYGRELSRHAQCADASYRNGTCDAGFPSAIVSLALGASF